MDVLVVCLDVIFVYQCIFEQFLDV